MNKAAPKATKRSGEVTAAGAAAGSAMGTVEKAGSYIGKRRGQARGLPLAISRRLTSYVCLSLG